MKFLTQRMALFVSLSNVALLSTMACSSSDGTTNPPSSADSGTPDGSSPDALGPKTDAGAGGDSGATTVSTGYVTFTQGSTLNIDDYTNSSSAAFYVLPAGTNLTCAGFKTVTTPAASNAACKITVCSEPETADAGTAADAGSSDGGAIIAPNSGDITLKSAFDTAGVVLTANTDGTYTGATSIKEWWAAGDGTVEVKSNGSSTSIPAFDNTALIGPGDVTSPMFNSTNVTGLNLTPVAFDRGTALAITYSAGTASTKLNVSLTTTSTAKRSIVSCDFDAANGSQSIPPADLANLEKADGSAITGTYTLQARTVKATTSGNFTFNVTLGATDHTGSFTNSN